MHNVAVGKAALLATILALVPEFAFAQASQGDRSSQSPTSASQPQSPATATDSAASGQADRGRFNELIERLSQSELRDRLSSAIERVRTACAEDFAEVCGGVDAGSGRLAACVKENADGLGLRCRVTLFRVTRNLRNAVADTVDECEGAIRAQCSNADKFGDCAEQKSASVSPACNAVVTALRHAGQKLSELKGMSVFSADDKDLGRVVDVQRGPDGKIQSVQIQVGRFLGIGDKVVTIGSDKLEALGDRIRLRLSSGQVGSLPEAKSATR